MKAEIFIRPATMADADYVGKRLRADDVREIEALGQDPVRATRLCVASSDLAFTGWINGEPAMVFGCGKSLTSDWGEIWALGTDVLNDVPRPMLTYGRKYLHAMLDVFPKLENHCDARYARALKWLEKIGFQIEPPAPYGPKGAMFCRITAERGE